MRRLFKKLVSRIIAKEAFHRFAVERWTLASAAQGYVDYYLLRQYSPTDARYFRWLYSLELTRDLPGEVVELGVGPGRFTVYAGSWLKKRAPEKKYWGYDTFAGFPSIHEKDLEGLDPARGRRMQKGVYSFYNRKRIEKLARHFRLDNVRFVEGDLVKTVLEERPEKISFLYIDVDLYEGYMAGLEALYDRVVDGGVILFDEYEWVKEWPGAKRAVDEFFADKPEKVQKLPFSDSHFVIRSRMAQ